MRESPAIDIIHLLIEKGAHVLYHDPYVPHFSSDVATLDSVASWQTAINEVDCVVIATDHSDYQADALVSSPAIIVDTRNVLRRSRV